MPARTLWVSTLLLLVAITACASEGEETTYPGIEWEEPSAYRFVVASNCGERTFLGQYEVTVRDGAVVDAQGLDETAAAALSGADPGEFVPTIDQMIEELLAAAESGADSTNIEIDDGVPKLIEIDYDADAVDDETCYQITGLEILEGAPGSSTTG